MKIVDGKEVDRDILLKLRNELWPHHGIKALQQQISDLMSSNDEFLYVGFEGDSPVGFIELKIRDSAPGSDNARVPYLEGWCVSPSYRNRGYGRRLVAFAERWAKEQGYRVLASDTTTRYPGSIEAHKAIGFKEVKTVHDSPAKRWRILTVSMMCYAAANVAE